MLRPEQIRSICFRGFEIPFFKKERGTISSPFQKEEGDFLFSFLNLYQGF